jgi:hypothetical protein
MWQHSGHKVSCGRWSGRTGGIYRAACAMGLEAADPIAKRPPARSIRRKVRQRNAERWQIFCGRGIPKSLFL